MDRLNGKAFCQGRIARFVDQHGLKHPFLILSTALNPPRADGVVFFNDPERPIEVRRGVPHDQCRKADTFYLPDIERRRPKKKINNAKPIPKLLENFKGRK